MSRFSQILRVIQHVRTQRRWLCGTTISEQAICLVQAAKKLWIWHGRNTRCLWNTKAHSRHASELPESSTAPSVNVQQEKALMGQESSPAAGAPEAARQDEPAQPMQHETASVACQTDTFPPPSVRMPRAPSHEHSASSLF